MKKTFFITLTLITMIVLAACTTKKDPDIHGYVLERINGNIFVVSKHAHDFSENGGVSEFYDAIVLDNAPSDVDVGHEVRVWYKGPVRESYPLGGSVGSLEIVEIAKPEGANLTREEAIKKALETIIESNFIAITEVEFDDQNHTWKISYKPIEYYEDEPPELQIVEIEDSIS